MMVVCPLTLPAGSPVLVVGAGGGFDFFCGLPIVRELEVRGHPVALANYSFTRLSAIEGAMRHSDHLWEVGADARLDDDYFPERDVSAWYAERKGVKRSVWCLARGAVGATRASYDYLVQRFGIETVICVDGGIDGIFRGDEVDLATPSMDAVSVISASLCKAPRRVYAVTAFGVEGAEGTVSHGQALERMADLVREDAMLGVGTILRTNGAGADFLDAASYVFARMSSVRRSVIVSSLVAATNGAFGRTAVNDKTLERQPWLSPLTQLVWYFDAEAVARMKLYYQGALSANTLSEVGDAIESARQAHGVKGRVEIPI